MLTSLSRDGIGHKAERVAFENLDHLAIGDNFQCARALARSSVRGQADEGIAPEALAVDSPIEQEAVALIGLA